MRTREISILGDGEKCPRERSLHVSVGDPGYACVPGAPALPLAAARAAAAGLLARQSKPVKFGQAQFNGFWVLDEKL